VAEPAQQIAQRDGRLGTRLTDDQAGPVQRQHLLKLEPLVQWLVLANQCGHSAR
jgi:hypothetical protein